MKDVAKEVGNRNVYVQIGTKSNPRGIMHKQTQIMPRVCLPLIVLSQYYNDNHSFFSIDESDTKCKNNQHKSANNSYTPYSPPASTIAAEAIIADQCHVQLVIQVFNAEYRFGDLQARYNKIQEI
jgi:hypothetical protein